MGRSALRRKFTDRRTFATRIERGGYAQLALLTLAYFLAGVLGLRVGLIEQGAVTTLWIPSGIALAVILAVGWVAVPIVLIGDLLVSLGSGFPIPLALMLAVVTTAEALLAGWLLRSFWRIDLSFSDVRSVLLLLAAAVVAPLVSATPGILLLVANGHIAGGDAASAWRAWWLADAMAILLVTPLILVWSRPGQVKSVRAMFTPARHTLEVIALFAGVVLTTLYAFRDVGSGLSPGAFMVFPFLVLAGLRLGAHGATAACFLAAAVALWRLQHPVATVSDASSEDILMLQFFFGVPTGAALLLAAALAERARALGLVVAQRDALETTVASRTAELASLNRQLRARVDDLASTNEELEAFSYSASHDLRAPLRRMDMLIDVLVEDEAQGLDPSGREVIDRLQKENKRLKQLVDDLLKLSRVSRAEVRHEQADLSKIAREVITEFRRETPGRDVEVRIQPHLVAHADPGLMRIALENLLNNAWKYTSPTPRAVIEMTGMRDADGTLELCIHDNGIGFPSKDAPLLFRPFRRLHAETEVEGTGVGLATVRRIVERHGGSVSAHGEPGKGARFCMRLPPG